MNRLPKFCSARKIRLLLEMLEKLFIGARLLVLAYAVFSGGTCLKMLDARKLLLMFVLAKQNAMLACSQKPFDTPLKYVIEIRSYVLVCTNITYFTSVVLNLDISKYI